MMKLMFGERTSFAITSIFLWKMLNKIGLINVEVKQFISFNQVTTYTLQMICATVCIHIFTTKYSLIVYILFFIVLNFLIAWEEEFVYRLLIPEILQKLFISSFVVCLLQSLIFGYLGHMEGTILDNLVYRVPLAIVLYQIRSKTGSILLSTTLHAFWNIVLDFV